MEIQTIEKRLLRYIPKKIRKYVVWLEFVECSHVYFLTFEKDGKEINAEPSDTVSELTWNAKQCIPELEAQQSSCPIVFPMGQEGQLRLSFFSW